MSQFYLGDTLSSLCLGEAKWVQELEWKHLHIGYFRMSHIKWNYNNILYNIITFKAEQITHTIWIKVPGTLMEHRVHSLSLSNIFSDLDKFTLSYTHSHYTWLSKNLLWQFFCVKKKKGLFPCASVQHSKLGARKSKKDVCFPNSWWYDKTCAQLSVLWK